VTDKLFGTVPTLTAADPGEQKCSVLYIGRAKTGKTHCVMSWPKPLVIYWDSNDATMRKFLDNAVDVVLPRTFKEFENQILPRIANREVDCETIVMDSYSFAASLLKLEVQGGRDKPRVQDWGTIFETLTRVTNAIASTTSHDAMAGPHKDRRYHFVATTHDRDTYDDDGNLVKVDPAIQGQFKDWLPRYFNTVLVTGSEISKKMLKPPGSDTAKITYSKDYFCWTCPPTGAWPAGDGFGGGKYKELPAKVDGTYPGLASAWGL